MEFRGGWNQVARQHGSAGAILWIVLVLIAVSRVEASAATKHSGSPAEDSNESPAAVRDRAFLEGLRERAFFDTAIEYLDLLEQQNSGSRKALAETLDLERAITLQQMAAASRIPDERESLIEKAETAFQLFLDSNPDHELAPKARFSLGELLLERARTRVWQAETPSKKNERQSILKNARLQINEAEKIFRKAYEGYEAQYRSYPSYIDETEQPESFRKRQDAEMGYLRAWLSLSRCSYERGHTWDRSSEERRSAMEKARESFDEIYRKRRTSPIGVHARMMSGRCFQEVGDLSSALGIYQEILSQDSDHPSVKSLRNTAVHFRLMCLNDAQKKEYSQVVVEATDWAKQNPAATMTSVGIAILWEKAAAQDSLAKERSLDEKQRDELKKLAAQDALVVARFPGPLREPAQAMVRRLQSDSGEPIKVPKDFATAFDQARRMVDQIQQLNGEIEEAGGDEERKARVKALDDHLHEVARLLNLALSLREDDTDRKAATQARYLLSFINYRQKNYPHALILATDCMVRDRAADPETAENASEIAVSSAVQIWSEAPEADRAFETAQLQEVCQKVLEFFPESQQAGEARLRLGRIYQQMKQTEDALRWLLEIPESDSHYGSARISAGQALWVAWSERAEAGASSSDTSDQKQKARQYLEEGLKSLRAKLTEGSPPTEEIVAAEVSLAGLDNMEGAYQQSITRLTAGEKNSVTALIAVPEGTQRPTTGIRSRAFAGLTYRLLLRAYVGTQQIEDAVSTMNLLKACGDQDVTGIYTQLGLELQKELESLKQSGDQKRLLEVRASFEQFVEEVYRQRNAGDFNSLLWIGETYSGLAQGLDDPKAAEPYFAKATQVYTEMLAGESKDKKLLDAVRIRLIRCQRGQLRFEEAMQTVRAILEQTPHSLDAQMEAAYTLADWGSQGGDSSHLLEAIQGIRNERNELVIWGWLNTARRIQQAVSQNPSPEFEERLLTVRYQLSDCRRRFAAAGGSGGEAHLKAGLSEITAFTRISDGMSNEWWSKFEGLHQNIQKALNQPLTPLTRPEGGAEQSVAAAGENGSTEGNEPKNEQGTTTADTTTAGGNQNPADTTTSGSPDQLNGSGSESAETGSESLILPVVAGALGIGLLSVVYFLFRKPRKNHRRALRSLLNEESPTFEHLEAGPSLAQLQFSSVPKKATLTETKPPKSTSDTSGVRMQASATRRPTASPGTEPPAKAPAATKNPTPAKSPATRDAPAAGAARPVTPENRRPPNPRPSNKQPPASSSEKDESR